MSFCAFNCVIVFKTCTSKEDRFLKTDIKENKLFKIWCKHILLIWFTKHPVTSGSVCSLCQKCSPVLSLYVWSCAAGNATKEITNAHLSTKNTLLVLAHGSWLSTIRPHQFKIWPPHTIWARILCQHMVHDSIPEYVTFWIVCHENPQLTIRT